MEFKALGLGLGVFLVALGAAELFGAKRIARTLEAEVSEKLIRAFGVRELVAGAGLLAAPAVATNVWGRVAGDALDLTALGAAARAHPRNRAVWGAILFVLGATAVDIYTARGLDRTTGRMLPA
ncbi:hypothetical protein [Sphingomonas sp. Leaf343]|uniref:hypothetical protein n=1 Tax=Sphingomonas sp. Leaf343 TaxID=1736345 RepID=UPI0006FEC171|nr:hypothetical protein [Sphingomonas sp. Leaf343]KQR84034.1 hypothetical protein ASG07_05365 [Sphingomonas sp. Leaf343]